MSQKKAKKRKLTPFGKFLKYTYRTILVVSAFIVTLYVAWNWGVQPPVVAQPNPKIPAVADDPDTPDIDESQSGSSQTRKETYYTFLLVATDQMSNSTDTILVGSYDGANQKASLVSLPRDTLVDRRVGPYHYYRLNSAYSNGQAANGADGGIAELREAVSSLLGIPIDYYVVVDVPSFVTIVDAVGGVDFEVPVKMDYDAPDQDLHIHYEPKLYYGLTGQQVLEIARCRKNTVWKHGSYTLYDAYPDAEIGRTRTQQALLTAIAKKLVSWGSLTKMGDFITIFNKSVDTNLSMSDMLYFGSQALKMDLATGVSTATFPGVGDVSYKGLNWLYQYERSESLEIINTTLNPYIVPVTEHMTHMPQFRQ